MLITLRNNNSDINVSELIPSVKLNIFRRIMRYGFSADDIKLSKYLQKNYNMSLRAAALFVYSSLVFNANLENDVTVIVNNTKADKLASIINYGTKDSGRSNILKYAFNKID